MAVMFFQLWTARVFLEMLVGRPKDPAPPQPAPLWETACSMAVAVFIIWVTLMDFVFLMFEMSAITALHLHWAYPPPMVI